MAFYFQYSFLPDLGNNQCLSLLKSKKFKVFNLIYEKHLKKENFRGCAREASFSLGCLVYVDYE